jgi:hypothetical protein
MQIKKSPFTIAIAISLAVHLLIVVALIQFPLLLRPAFGSFFGLNFSSDPAIAKSLGESLNTYLLEEAFEEVTIAKRKPFDAPEDLKIDLSAHPLTPRDHTFSPISALSDFAEDEVADGFQTIQEPVVPLSILTESTTPALSDVKVDKAAPKNRIGHVQAPPSKNDEMVGDKLVLRERPVRTEEEIASVETFEQLASTSFDFESENSPSDTALPSEPSVACPPIRIYSSAKVKPPENWKRRAVQKESFLAPLSKYGFPEEIGGLALEAEFDSQVHVMPQKDGEGFVFSVLLKAQPTIQVEPMVTHFVFLIDRSSTIEKHRYTVFKKAVVRALSSIEEGNTFNIVIFDNKITQLSDERLAASKKNIEMAEAFLEKQPHGGRFSSSDVYAHLEKLIPAQSREDEVITPILLTDGKTTLKMKKLRQAVSKWLEKSKGKVSVHTAAVGQENQLVLLDMLSVCTGGELHYSDTHAAFPRKLAKAVLDIQAPLTKRVEIDTLCADSEASITLFPVSATPPILYLDKPYLIQGTIDTLADFTLVLEGQSKEQKVQIIKKISLDDARKGTPILEKKWTLKQASLCYEDFLKEGTAAALNEAKLHLRPISGEAK